MVFKIYSRNREKQFNLLVKKSEERIKSAKILSKEELFNDSISRAYYSFFDAANALLVTKGLSAFSVELGRQERKLITNCLKNFPKKTPKK